MTVKGSRLKIVLKGRITGSPKIRVMLAKAYPMIRLPAACAIYAMLDRHGLVRRRKDQGTRLGEARSRRVKILMQLPDGNISVAHLNVLCS